MTGGRGQLGWELADLLAAGGIPFWAPGHAELDITDPRAVEAALDGHLGPVAAPGVGGPGPAGAPPTLVINAAAFNDVDRCETDVDRAYAENATAAENLAVACEGRSIPLVHVSTDFVFDGRKDSPYETTDAPAPLSVYGASKLAGEEAVRRLAKRHYIVRSSWLFGAHGRNFPRAILEAAVAGRRLRVVDDQTGSPTHARDLAEILLRLAGVTGGAPAPYGLYHAANAGSCSRFDFAQEILRQAGWGLPVEPMSSAELDRPARRPGYSVLSLAGLEQVGIRPPSWRQGLADFLTKLTAMEPGLFPGGGREE